MVASITIHAVRQRARKNNHATTPGTSPCRSRCRTARGVTCGSIFQIRSIWSLSRPGARSIAAPPGHSDGGPSALSGCRRKGDRLPAMAEPEAPALSRSAPRTEQMFPTLTPAQIARIAAHGSVRPIRSGEVLVEAGEQGVPFYVITTGQVEIVRPTGTVETPVALHGPGQFTGEVNMLSARRSPARARAPARRAGAPARSTGARPAARWSGRAQSSPAR